MSAPNAAYTQLCSLLRDAAHLGAVSSLISWDQETYMPPSGASGRADQSSILAGIVHERQTSPKIAELLAACEQDADLTKPGSATAANLREIRRDYELATKLPKELVEELAKAGSMAQQVWKEAREKSDFALFAPHLERMFLLTRRKAECLGVPRGGELYDALIDEYEPNTPAAEIEKVFTPLRARLSELLKRVQADGNPPSEKPLLLKFEPEVQHALGLFVLEKMGFDLKAGRLDTTTHPFCSGMGPGDVRLTTRYRGEKWTDALYGTLHEMGHGLYEQGLPKDSHFGEPLGASVSLGIHESQSRMWENFVGRGKPFWKWLIPHARKILGKRIDRYDVKDYFFAANTARPSLIRVEADEATYNLHVMLRFEIERGLLRGDIKVRDVPAEWNRRVKEFLGLDVPDDRRGCLQDVHWSFGLIGYFPTYTLGNLYAAQMWEKINKDLPDLTKDIGKGKFGALKAWLNTNIHAHGRRYSAAELCKRATGSELSSEPLLRHLSAKIKTVYGV
ncbi:MAG: carboxypeptidase M32 [Phycisphaeraceae bacterium]|nr:carboxypeptidase M32 [Phycisphaeraceae bacterium]